MTFWRRVFFWCFLFLLGRQMNVWQITTYGFMPLSFPWGGWIPIAGRWLASIGDVLQVIGFLMVILLTWVRFLDERYARRVV